jgi:ferredoxin--NADP+ reductase
VPHRIVSKKELSENVFTAEVEARLIAQAGKPGQFVIISINNEYGERIPLTIADADPQKGTIRLIWQRVGKTTVVCVGGGIGNAPLLPIAKALKKAGNQIISILGARTKELVILEDEFGQISDELIITTDDGSYGRKALVTEPLKE